MDTADTVAPVRPDPIERQLFRLRRTIQNMLHPTRRMELEIVRIRSQGADDKVICHLCNLLFALDSALVEANDRIESLAKLLSLMRFAKSVDNRASPDCPASKDELN